MQLQHQPSVVHLALAIALARNIVTESVQGLQVLEAPTGTSSGSQAITNVIDDYCGAAITNHLLAQANAA